MKWLYRISCFFTAAIALVDIAVAQTFITSEPARNALPLVSATQVTPIYVDQDEDWLVHKAASLLQQDIEMVTDRKPAIIHKLPTSGDVIIIGSAGKSAGIQQLLRTGKIRSGQIQERWESFLIQTVSNPARGVRSALVIAGHDKRGTAYGVMEVSRQMGVSPWYWWADVPVKKKPALYASANTFKTDAPAVKYRGIFINDEAPALSGWAREKFGGFNHLFYEKVFELMTRLKSNYLWPAMWGNAFYDDDPLNKQTADNYGIVIGTSHHEPLMRAHDEWRRYGKGKWNYDSNAATLQEFWRGGLQRAGQTEKIVSIGMRGDGDMPMTQGTAIALLEKIVKDQRNIIEEVTGKPAEETPQLWALYKEVQDYYDKGMRVPDDVTLLLCDDNWGNIRRLPKPAEKPRKGGYGIYYHFDYVGGPRNYKWINTNNISRVWEQMHLAWAYNARQIWIVNVGDIKPMELPISFFLDYAWDPAKVNAEDLPAYHERWAEEQFGKQYAKDIAYLLQKYGQYSSRRKPELLSHDTYNIRNGEWKRVIEEDLTPLKDLAEKINNGLPPSYKDAFFQLVLHPIRALENLHRMYYMVALNHHNAGLKNIAANSYADSVRLLYIRDSLITRDYHQLGGGKWNHMMSQTHIGYTYWQQPPANKMPTVILVDPDSAVASKPEEYTRKLQVPAGWIPRFLKTNFFVQYDSCISMEAEHYSRAIGGAGIQWKVIPHIGRTAGGLCAWPVTAPAQRPNAHSPHVEYVIYAGDSGAVTMQAYFSPTLNFHNSATGLQYAISIDDEELQIIPVNKEDNNVRTWEKWVASNIIIKTSAHTIKAPGRHVVKFWLVDPGLVLQKLVLNFGAPVNDYLGYPETKGN